MTRSLLVVHGALGSGDQMRPVIDALQSALPSVIVRGIELPGHGRTPGDDPRFTMDTFAATLGEAAADALADAAADAAPIVFGYSMGGYAALWQEVRTPGSFAAIVTLGTMLDWSPAVAEHAARRLDPATISAKVPAFAAQLASRHAEAGGWETVLRRTGALLRQLGDHPPLTPSLLAGVRCPVHALVGERDDTTAFATTQAWMAAIPQGTATLLPEVPHPIERVPLPLLTSIVSETVALIG